MSRDPRNVNTFDQSPFYFRSICQLREREREREGETERLREKVTEIEREREKERDAVACVSFWDIIFCRRPFLS